MVPTRQGMYAMQWLRSLTCEQHVRLSPRSIETRSLSLSTAFPFAPSRALLPATRALLTTGWRCAACNRDLGLGRARTHFECCLALLVIHPHDTTQQVHSGSHVQPSVCIWAWEYRAGAHARRMVPRFGTPRHGRPSQALARMTHRRFIRELPNGGRASKPLLSRSPNTSKHTSSNLLYFWS